MAFKTNIVFIGGIHGVGKGTICKELALKSEWIHITASQILNWNEISSKGNKLVNDISSTQERLVYGLNNFLKEDSKYLLDGHFCLLNSEGIPQKINEEIFDYINPKIISVVIDDVAHIAKRLNERDNKIYETTVLKDLQEMEIEYAKYLSEKYSIQYIEIINGDFKSLLNSI